MEVVHTSQLAKRDQRDLHWAFLDVANEFGSVPHSLLWEAVGYFRFPDIIKGLIRDFQDIQMFHNSIALKFKYKTCVLFRNKAVFLSLPIILV